MNYQSDVSDWIVIRNHMNFSLLSFFITTVISTRPGSTTEPVQSLCTVYAVELSADVQSVCRYATHQPL